MNELSPADRVLIHQHIFAIEAYLQHLSGRMHRLVCKRLGCNYGLG